MEIREAFYKFCINNPDINNEIGTRLYYKKAPQNTVFPYGIYFVVSNPTIHDIDIAMPRFQIDLYGYEPMHKAAEAFKKALRRYKGLMGDRIIKQVILLDESDLESGQTDIYRISLDFQIIYKDRE